MMEDLRVIHLKRRNILRTLVSREIADRTGVWAEQESRGRPTAKKQISLSPSALRRGFEQTRRWERDFDRRFAQHALLTIFYEDLVEDPVATFRDVTRFLGIDMREPEIATQRQNPEPLHQLITNLEDLQDEFADSEWAEFFHE